MAFPLATVLSAAPGLISAAAEVIRIIRDRKKTLDTPQPDIEKIKMLEGLIEQQAQLIEELAINNRNLVMAVRNNRIIAIAALAIGLLSLVFAIATF